jgi:hypothetical protein
MSFSSNKSISWTDKTGKKAFRNILHRAIFGHAVKNVSYGPAKTLAIIILWSLFFN